MTSTAINQILDVAINFINLDVIDNLDKSEICRKKWNMLGGFLKNGTPDDGDYTPILSFLNTLLDLVPQIVASIRQDILNSLTGLDSSTVLSVFNLIWCGVQSTNFGVFKLSCKVITSLTKEIIKESKTEVLNEANVCIIIWNWFTGNLAFEYPIKTVNQK